MIDQRSRGIQIAAILGRFNGDHLKAVDYCIRMAEENPKLWDEYKTYQQEIEYAAGLFESPQSAHATV
jgi:hypothetical protein